MRYFQARRVVISLSLLTLLLILAACGSGGSTIPTPHIPNNTPKLAAKQVLTFPNVGIADSAPLDPALVSDSNTGLIVTMVYSGLVRENAQLEVVPDQATWDISPDNSVYTFHLRQNVAFSDGTAVTAQTYVYSLTRALLPEVQSGIASFYEGRIVGANDVLRGKTKTLAGVKALDIWTLQIRLTRPMPYFLQLLTSSIFFPVNKLLIDQYGQADWPNNVAGNAAGTGPFMVKEWKHSVSITLIPNPRYYGSKTNLTEVRMLFAGDSATAFVSYRAGQYDFAWNLTATDQVPAKALPGFTRVPQLETDALYFNVKMPPFDNAIVRQAFAYATDKVTLAHSFFNDSVAPAGTIIPPGMPSYQQAFPGISYDANKAKRLLQSVYSDVSTVPPITFSYPSTLFSTAEAATLQGMWQSTLGIPITMRSVELTAYNDEMLKHQIAFGFTQWSADFADPYDCLALNLLSTAVNNTGAWSNASFDQMIMSADKTTGSVRMTLYSQAEQIALQDVGWLPLDHQTLAAVIPSWIHGVSVNADGLYFGDWSEVYLLQH